MSHFERGRRYCYVDAESTRLSGVQLEVAAFDFERVFRAEYAGIARVISRVLQDHSRAQELAAAPDFFLPPLRAPKKGQYISNKRPSRFVILSGAKDLCPARDPSLRSG